MFGLEEARLHPNASQGGVHEAFYGVDNLPAKIYERDVLQVHESEVAGEAVFKKELYIQIQQPMMHKTKKGDLIDRKFKEKDKLTYPQAWEAWQNRSSEELSGTPLSSWEHPLLDTALRLHLTSMRIVTIEQIALMADSGIGVLGQYGRWLKKAAEDELKQRFIDRHNVVSVTQVEDLQAQNQALMERLAALESLVGTSKSKKGKKAEEPVSEEVAV